MVRSRISKPADLSSHLGASRPCVEAIVNQMASEPMEISVDQTLHYATDTIAPPPGLCLCALNN